MINPKIIKQSKTDVEFELTLDEKEILPHKTHVVASMATNIKIAGFRPGKAPIHLAEKQLDQQKLQAEILQDLIMYSYSKAVAKMKFETISEPKIALQKFVPFTTLTYKASVALMPQFKLPDLNTLKLTHKANKVSDQQVNEAIEQLLQAQAQRNKVDRAAKLGDEVVIDFEGSIDGKKISGADGKDYKLILGSKSFIPGFEKNLVGTSADQEKIFELVFPKDYHSTNLAGKKVSFKVNIKSVNQLNIAKLTDETAAKLSGSKSVAELKQDIKHHLQQRHEEVESEQFREQVLKALLEKTSIEAPKTLLDDQIADLRNELIHNLKHNNQTLEQYLTTNSKTSDQLDSELAEQASSKIRLGIILRKIVAEQKISVSDDEVDNQYKLLLMQYGNDEQSKQQLQRPNFKEDLKSSLISEKAISYIINKAKENKENIK